MHNEEQTAEVTSKVCSRNPTLFKVAAHSLSVVQWVSPRLDSLSAGLLDDIVRETEETSLTSSIQRAISQFDERINVFVSEKCPEYPFHHLRLIKTLDWPVFVQTEAIHSDTARLQLETSSTKTKTKISAALERIVRFAEGIVKTSQYAAENYKLFILESGEIRLGPSTVVKGDLCCMFSRLGPDLIIRANEDARTFETVGRAAPIISDLEERPTYSETFEVIFQVGMEALLDITGFESRATSNMLYKASSEGCVKLVKLLVEKGVNVNFSHGEYGTALHQASFAGHEAVVKLLLEHGANINTQNERRGSALQVASTWGHEAVVKLLLDNGADANSYVGIHETALEAAVLRGLDRVAKLLRDNGATEHEAYATFTTEQK
jgi:hypothetical protein